MMKLWTFTQKCIWNSILKPDTMCDVMCLV